ncbi:hypothetical protein MVEN_01699200 [Mycena venus]|uniref:Protein kinase domain-containing protein n=1 Tax=Mycena venus TaxID=2733690 RepID=A0A8H7CNB5_9AGAR|nr:hypothetical protein MVEN_01699200 [Mycena venus]
MGEEPHVDTEFAFNSSTNIPGSRMSGSGMFSGSQGFTVTGGNLTNVTNNYTSAPTVPPDFPMISMGNIDLQFDHNIGVVHRYHERPCVRRVHSAKIDGRKSDMTVAIYQGDGAKEEWRRDIEKYMSVRHPNIVQICGTATSHNIHATVFHGDLIPFKHFVNLGQHSPISTVYIYAYASAEFEVTQKYFSAAFQRDLDDYACTFWIRRSTKRLCVDLHPGDETFTRVDFSPAQGIHEVTQEAAIASLTLEQYHEICYWDLSRHRELLGSTPITVNLGAIISCSSEDQLDNSVEIAFLPDAEVRLGQWNTDGEVTSKIMEDGWTRFDSGDLLETTIRLDFSCTTGEPWPSQANHIFSHLQLSSNLQDCVVVEDICFKLKIPAAATDAPSGFLFMCPEEDFRTGLSSFRWPDFPAYWSLDSKGVERLSMEEAKHLGFPFIQLSTEVSGMSWDASVYAGLHQFHQAKGFDPDSQDVARHLGHTLYQLSSEVDAPFAHVEDSYSEEEDCDSADADAHLENGEATLNNGADVSNAGFEQPEVSSLSGEIHPVSRTLALVMRVQLALILFLASLWLYDQV